MQVYRDLISKKLTESAAPSWRERKQYHDPSPMFGRFWTISKTEIHIGIFGK
jgi:hypothetical protein